MSLGGGEILVILLVALIVFGPTRLPDIARQVGKAMSEVRKMQDSVKREIHGALNTDDENMAQGIPTYDEHQVPPDQPEPHPEYGRDEPPPLPQADTHRESPSAGSFS
jgi:Tat protein translocase TatB subunit